MTARVWPRRLPSVRARTALAAVAVAGTALVVAGVLLVHILSSSLTAAVDASARLRVEAVANIVAGGTVPPVLAVPGDDSVVVQVIDPTGRVIASSDNVADEPALVSAGSATPTIRVVTVHAVPVAEQGASRLAFRSVSTPRGTWTVAAAASLGPASHTVATLSVTLAGGIPLLLALVGLTAWLLAGRALAPVEAIRSQVAEISGRALHRRVPEPGGHDEVARLARTMNDMLERLEESQASQRRFVANASHELRSPVASALTQLQVDRAHPETADWDATADGVESELYRVQGLVANLLELARADEGALARDRTAVALDEMLRHEIRRHQAVSRVPIDAGNLPPIEIDANATELRRAVANVMVNAVRHARAGVAVSLSDNGDDIVIAVADDGPGIPAADRERVFGRFIRLDDARSRDAGGAGLGLAIAKEIVESHGGWIAVADAQPGARLELHFWRGGPPPNRWRGQAPSTVGVGRGDGCLQGG
ncbi:MAG TPA: ATP-binding protein [Acidimicrobiales bacterium]|jgi:signal transduction histidine kinase|nr:ATP-binding protein [Acidimicrobiales bacterium]